jgi:hypothetical protein
MLNITRVKNIGQLSNGSGALSTKELLTKIHPQFILLVNPVDNMVQKCNNSCGASNLLSSLK